MVTEEERRVRGVDRPRRNFYIIKSVKSRGENDGETKFSGNGLHDVIGELARETKTAGSREFR